MSTSHKKVIVRRFFGDVLAGYLPVSAFVTHGTIHLLDLAGRVLPISLPDIKLISYVRDFNLTDTVNPERLTRRAFLARPRSEGLWIRLTFRSGDQIEGLAPADQVLLDDLINDLGLHLTPPDVRSNTQRIYVPRSSLSDLQLLAVITAPSRRKPLRNPEIGSLPKDLQEDLFDPLPTNTQPN